MSVFLTPDLKPFYGGTYFPPRRSLRPQRRLQARAGADRRSLEDNGATRSASNRPAVTEYLQQIVGSRQPGDSASCRPRLLENACRALARHFDPATAASAGARSFRTRWNCACCSAPGSASATTMPLHMVRTTLDKMAAGGIYDQLGGGFHRYSTDERWLVPHFEKMLYDNALLDVGLSRGVAGDRRAVLPRDRRGDARLRASRDDQPGRRLLFSTQDADSEGEEGKFYVWTKAEIEAVLGKEEARFVLPCIRRHRAGQLRRPQHPSPHQDVGTTCHVACNTRSRHSHAR